jgi:DNA-binding response OmpR family regulator
MILNQNGYRALEAANAEQAESKFRSNPIDMVLVDHGLGITGSEVAGQLRAIRSVPVLMLSGNAELKEVPANVDLLLPKPYPVRDLFAAMEKLFASNAQLISEQNSSETKRKFQQNS